MNVWLQTLWLLCPALAQYLLLVRTETYLIFLSAEINHVKVCILNNRGQITVLFYVCDLFVLTGLPNRPGTPEIPQKYNNTALVLWRPSDTMAPCTYSLERKAEGQCSQTRISCSIAYLRLFLQISVIVLLCSGLPRFSTNRMQNLNCRNTVCFPIM